MELVLWKPFRELSLLTKEMDRILARFIGERSLDRGFGEAWSPLVDISETKDSVVVKADLPGLEAKDVNCSISWDVLTIKGEKKAKEEEENEHYHCTERYSGSFHRLFKMPSGVKADQTKATFDKGVLKVTLPKVDESREKKILVKVKNKHEALLPRSIIKTNVL